MKYFLLISFLVLKISHTYAYTDPLLETYECDGSEVTAAKDQGRWADYSCNNGEWLMRIDEKVPFTIRLEKSREIQSDMFDYYNMVPTIPVSPKHRWILKRHWFRVSNSGQIEFVMKRAE